MRPAFRAFAVGVSEQQPATSWKSQASTNLPGYSGRAYYYYEGANDNKPAYPSALELFSGGLKNNQLRQSEGLCASSLQKLKRNAWQVDSDCGLNDDSTGAAMHAPQVPSTSRRNESSSIKRPRFDVPGLYPSESVMALWLHSIMLGEEPG